MADYVWLYTYFLDSIVLPKARKASHCPYICISAEEGANMIYQTYNETRKALRRAEFSRKTNRASDWAGLAVYRENRLLW